MPSRIHSVFAGSRSHRRFRGRSPSGQPADGAREIGFTPPSAAAASVQAESIPGAGSNSGGRSRAASFPRAKPGEEAASAPGPRANIRADVNVVLVPVTVTDPLSRFVTGLDQDAFEVYEDKIKQKIVSFGSEDAPLSIGIVFDTSASMGNKLERSRLSVAEFFKTANPEDEAFLVEFNDRPATCGPHDA